MSALSGIFLIDESNGKRYELPVGTQVLGRGGFLNADPSNKQLSRQQLDATVNAENPSAVARRNDPSSLEEIPPNTSVQLFNGDRLALLYDASAQDAILSYVVSGVKSGGGGGAAAKGTKRARTSGDDDSDNEDQHRSDDEADPSAAVAAAARARHDKENASASASSVAHDGAGGGVRAAATSSKRHHDDADDDDGDGGVNASHTRTAVTKASRGGGDDAHGSDSDGARRVARAGSAGGNAKSGNSTRTECQYGAKCYRKNPAHFRDFWHPGDPEDPAVSGKQQQPPPRPSKPTASTSTSTPSTSSSATTTASRPAAPAATAPKPKPAPSSAAPTRPAPAVRALPANAPPSMSAYAHGARIADEDADDDDDRPLRPSSVADKSRAKTNGAAVASHTPSGSRSPPASPQPPRAAAAAADTAPTTPSTQPLAPRSGPAVSAAATPASPASVLNASLFNMSGARPSTSSTSPASSQQASVGGAGAGAGAAAKETKEPGALALAFPSLATSPTFAYDRQLAAAVAFEACAAFLARVAHKRVRLLLVEPDDVAAREACVTSWPPVEERKRDTRLLIADAARNIFTLHTHAQSMRCRFIAACVTWRFKAITQEARDVYTRSGINIEEEAQRQFSTGEVTRTYTLQLPETSPLRRSQGVHAILLVVPPTVNASKPGSLHDKPDAARAALRRTYDSMLEAFAAAAGIDVAPPAAS